MYSEKAYWLAHSPTNETLTKSNICAELVLLFNFSQYLELFYFCDLLTEQHILVLLKEILVWII